MIDCKHCRFEVKCVYNLSLNFTVILIDKHMFEINYFLIISTIYSLYITNVKVKSE